MNKSHWHTSAWYNALTLAERTVSLNRFHKNISNVQVKTDLAKQKWNKWKLQSPFTTGSHFTERLAMEGITEDKFLELLGETAKTIQNRFSKSPSWIAGLEKAFSCFESSTQKLPLSKLLPEQKVSGFLFIIEPLIIQGHNRLQRGIKALIKTQAESELPFNPNTISKIFFENLPIQLIGKLSRTMVLELHVAQLQDKLEGNTPQERFQSFLQLLQERDSAIKILQEYPVLTRQLKICIDHWVDYSLEVLQHLYADWNEIKQKFSPDRDPGLLVELIGGVGDTHRDGRSVLIAKFSSGFQVVYKPKSLAVDVHFQELLNWINSKGNHPPFQTLKILDRGSYGWSEFITPQSCSSPEEVQRFYQRQGGYLALLYAIEAIDFHSENLIAVGEHPILVDLEALFHPRAQGIDITKSDELASQMTFENSVLRVQLLPQRFLSNAKYEGIEISGLGGKEGQLSPDRIPYLENIGTDEMRVTRQRMKMSGDQNQPTLNSIEVNVLDYVEEIIDGFTNIYQLLLRHRNELLLDNGLLARFAEDEVRVVLRPTRFYSKLLTESFHPDVLRNALDRDRLFDRLWFGVDRSSYLAHLTKVIPAEQKQLWNGDIPIFTTCPNSRDLCSGDGELFVNFFDESAMNLVKRRLQQLSEEDFARQLWFIRASFCTLAIGEGQEEEMQWPKYFPSEMPTVPERKQLNEQLLTAARSVGDRLEFLALHGKDDASWIGLTIINQKYWSLVPLDWDLYNGLSGIILFLAYLGKLTEEERYTSLAQAALTTIRSKVKRNQKYVTEIGLGGWGGLIYTMTQLSILWHQPKLLDEAEKIVELLPELIRNDEQLDILGGAAGCIMSLSCLYRCKPSQLTLTTAIQCGDHLIAQAHSMDRGIGWIPKGIGEKPLTGFSHGSAGIALALLELAALADEERFRLTALAAITYERSFFLPELGTWRDLRRDDNQDKCMIAWCHGASGIGLARLHCLRYLDDAKIHAEINTALKTTLNHGFGHNHSLCHGDLGNLELLLQASLTLDSFQWKTQVDRLSTIILESINKQGWLCGVPLGVETPGLMTGLAGIGYQLLRLVEPESVPSVLALEPPKV